MSKALTAQVIEAYIKELEQQLIDSYKILFKPIREKLESRLQDEISDAREALEWVKEVSG